MNDTVILTEKLTKKYNGFTAVNSLNLIVNRGEIFGLLGRPQRCRQNNDHLNVVRPDRTHLR